MSDTIKVMIVDDHSVIRQGFSIFLQAFADLQTRGAGFATNKDSGHVNAPARGVAFWPPL